MEASDGKIYKITGSVQPYSGKCQSRPKEFRPEWFFDAGYAKQVWQDLKTAEEFFPELNRAYDEYFIWNSKLVSNRKIRKTRQTRLDTLKTYDNPAGLTRTRDLVMILEAWRRHAGDAPPLRDEWAAWEQDVCPRFQKQFGFLMGDTCSIPDWQSDKERARKITLRIRKAKNQKFGKAFEAIMNMPEGERQKLIDQLSSSD
ncbi:hypothetical protein [Pseudovibrio sp. Tun.PSC04-5.I4]|uniref:hypothetical protein n=1 Tax=Pseudovibrio sp. Tun.PSC04-5.I4 TaxID=1798213 RepID=UPI000B873485|nr:hypothetical protein [Pseudovibrio sp. Tun.PSC04-5.I4]